MAFIEAEYMSTAAYVAMTLQLSNGSFWLYNLKYVEKLLVTAFNPNFCISHTPIV